MAARFDTEFFDPPLPRLFAHRGASGDFPENSLAAFDAAARNGVPYIELDVHMTSDDAIVVVHDDDLARVAGQTGIVGTLTMAEVQQYDIGYQFTSDGASFPFRGNGLRVPTLREVLATFSRQLFVIEIKQITPSLVRGLLEVIAETGMARRVLVASEHEQPLDEIRTLAPALPTNLSAREVAAFIMSALSGSVSFQSLGAALQIPPEHDSLRLVTPQTVAAAHRLGLEVHVWTINEAAQMRDLLAMGVDGLISDYPDRMRDVIAAR